MRQADVRDDLIKILWEESSDDVKKRAMARLLAIERKRDAFNQDENRDAKMAAKLAKIIKIKFHPVPDRQK